MAPKYELPPSAPPGAAPFQFSPPISTVDGDPIASWDEDFLAHKKALGDAYVTCTSGNRYAYWVDGPRASVGHATGGEDGPLKHVVCFHDGGMSKSVFISHAGVFGNTRIIAVDRLGHGSSAAEPEGEPMLFDRGVADILEIIDGVAGKDAEVYMLGHGTGGVWAIQVGVALKHRCLGISTLGAPMNPFHPQTRPVDRKQLVPKFMVSGERGQADATHFNPDAGRWSSTRARSRILHEAKQRVFANKLRDPGFAFFYEWRLKGDETQGDGGDERAFAAMDHDSFFISKILDAYLNGAHSSHVMLSEFRRCIEPWCYDPSEILCPLHLYHGSQDRRPLMHSGCAEALSRITGKHARVALMKEHGHISVLLEFRKILRATTGGMIVDSSFHRSHKLMPGLSSEASAAAAAVFMMGEMRHYHHAHDFHASHQVGRESLGLIHHEEEEHMRREGEGGGSAITAIQ